MRVVLFFARLLQMVLVDFLLIFESIVLQQASDRVEKVGHGQATFLLCRFLERNAMF